MRNPQYLSFAFNYVLDNRCYISIQFFICIHALATNMAETLFYFHFLLQRPTSKPSAHNSELRVVVSH